MAKALEEQRPQPDIAAACYSLQRPQKGRTFRATSMELAAAVVASVGAMVAAVRILLDHVDSPRRDRSTLTIVSGEQLLELQRHANKYLAFDRHLGFAIGPIE